MTNEPVGITIYKYWRDKWREHKGTRYPGNRAKESWKFGDIYEDLDNDGALLRQLIDYYFMSGRNDPDGWWFILNYDQLLSQMEIRERDRKHREQLRQQTKELYER